MPETGFFAQKQRSPTSLALVILLHASLIAAVVLIKGPAFTRLMETTNVRLIPIDPDPPPVQPPPPRPNQPHPQPVETIDHVRPMDTIPLGPPVDTSHQNTVIASTSVGNDILTLPVEPPRPIPPPVRHAAQIDPSSQLQPPYPATELRAQRDGRVQVRVTIGPDGRVVDVVLLSATSDAFWQTTRQQALHHWRFRPATVDGRPVEDTRVMSLIFRIEDQG